MSKNNGQKNFDNTSYEVGYGKPPAETRYKPRTSGNSRGRPRGRKTPSAVIYAIMNEKVAVQIGGKKRWLTKFEVMMQNLASQAVKGNPKAIATILSHVTEYGESINPPAGLRVVLVPSPKASKQTPPGDEEH